MKKLFVSIAAFATLTTVVSADQPLFDEKNVAACLAPDGSVSDCYDRALGMNKIDYWVHYSKIICDQVAVQVYIKTLEAGCNRGIALKESGSAIFDSDLKKTGKMCMERGVLYLDERRLKSAGWQNANSLIDESVEFLKKARVHQDTAREIGFQAGKVQELRNEAKWQVEAQRLDDECQSGNGHSCVQFGMMRLKKYPNGSNYSNRIEADRFRQGIAAGDSTAYFALAGLYLMDGKGNEAIDLLESGCKSGHALSCKTAANSLFLGENGVSIDIDCAGQLYEEACRLDPTDTESCNNVPKKPESQRANTAKKVAKKVKK